jgi:hypothetical protein
VVLSFEHIRDRQASARYPELLCLTPRQHDQAIYERRRPYTDIVAVALRHDDLSDAQMRALDEFRLDQYLLCGFYDAAYIDAHQITHDPDLYTLPRDTIHLMVGASDGRFLAYSYLQSPKGGEALTPTVTLSDPGRPWFPCEIESIGPDVFPSLPGLRHAPVNRLAEVSILLANQVVQGTASRYAVVEDLLALAMLQIAPRVDLIATLAYCDFEARKVIYDVGMTAIYAPEAPMLYNNLRPHWTAAANEPGRFWPSVFSSADFQRGRAHLEALDQLLSQPPRAIRAELVSWRRMGKRIEPHALLPAPGTSALHWMTAPSLDPAVLNSAEQAG